MNKNQLLEIFPIGPEHPDHRRFDPVTAIAGGAGIITNIAGGIIGNSAAKRAAAVQQQAAHQASDQVGVAVGDANKGISEASGTAQSNALAGGQAMVDTAARAAEGMNGAVTNANAILDPYSQAGQAAAGTLQKGLEAGGDFNKTPTLADLQIDPGYAFRLQQGQLAMERGAAARGGSMGGAAAKDLAGYSQGLASQEYQNAFNRFETSTQNRFSNLNAVSNSGQAAGTTQGNNLVRGAQYGGDVTMQGANANLGAHEFAGQIGMQGAGEIGQNLIGGANSQGNFLTGGANAQAAGIVGGANAITGGMTGAANSAMSAATLNLLRNPAQSNMPSLKTLQNLPTKTYTSPFAFGGPQ